MYSLNESKEKFMEKSFFVAVIEKKRKNLTRITPCYPTVCFKNKGTCDRSARIFSPKAVCRPKGFRLNIHSVFSSLTRNPPKGNTNLAILQNTTPLKGKELLRFFKLEMLFCVFSDFY